MNKLLFLLIFSCLSLAVLSVVRFVDSERDVNAELNRLDFSRNEAEREFQRRNALVTEKGVVLNQESLAKAAEQMKLHAPTVEQTAMKITP